jgi:3-deoxy-D-manno-octulosonic-acid transferase
MYSLVYNMLMYVALVLLKPISPLSSRLSRWFAVRSQWRKTLPETQGKKVFWMHVSSLGEFEQGRTVLDAFRKAYPDWFILLTFFSESGYRVRHSYTNADSVLYLPADTKANAKDFLNHFHPQLAIFVKYDFWYNYLFELNQRSVPTLLISASFRPTQPFFAWYGGLWRQMLQCFRGLYVQNTESVELLKKLNLPNVELIGDTRIDRVLELAKNATAQRLVLRSQNQEKCYFVAGSVWSEDLGVLESVFKRESKCYVIIAPHEPTDAIIKEIQTFLGPSVVLLSTFLKSKQQVLEQHMIVDTVGHLSQLYQVADLAYIGGGFGKGIHNILEPAAFGVPIIIGPQYHSFNEARLLVKTEGAFAVGDKKAFDQVFVTLHDEQTRTRSRLAISAFLAANKGATELIMQRIKAILQQD